MTALEKALERLEASATKLFASIDDLIMGTEPEPNYFIFNGIRGEEMEDGSIKCSCGRAYKTLKNWEKHVDSMHRGNK